MQEQLPGSNIPSAQTMTLESDGHNSNNKPFVPEFLHVFIACSILVLIPLVTWLTHKLLTLIFRKCTRMEKHVGRKTCEARILVYMQNFVMDGKNVKYTVPAFVKTGQSSTKPSNMFTFAANTNVPPFSFTQLPIGARISDNHPLRGDTFDQEEYNMEKNARFTRQGDELVCDRVGFMRANFAQSVYAIVKLLLMFMLISAAFWSVNKDLTSLIAYLGLAWMAMVFNVADFVKNYVAHLWIICSNKFSVGSIVKTAGMLYPGCVVSFTGMHVNLMCAIPNSDNSIESCVIYQVPNIIFILNNTEIIQSMVSTKSFSYNDNKSK